MANQWRCGSCGYRLEAETPPERCPACKQPCEFIDDNPYVPVEGGKTTGYEPVPEEAQPRVDAETCTGCGDCVEACPVEAIEMRDSIAWIDTDICCGDAICVGICPVNAIRPPD